MLLSDVQLGLQPLVDSFPPLLTDVGHRVVCTGGVVGNITCKSKW